MKQIQAIREDKTVQFFTKDARIFQIVYLSLFLLFGLFFLDWQVDISRYATTIGVCLAVQFVFIKIYKKDYHSIKSALITSLGLCLLLKTNTLGTAALAAFVSIASKFLVRVKGKHVFNPANLGIIAVVLLTGDAWVSPGQWGSSVIMLYFMGAAGLMILLKVGRIDTSITFLLTLFALEVVRSVIYKSWGIDVVMHQFTSGTILLFAFFMITDPVTTPNAPKARIIWAIAIGVLSFILSSWQFIHAAPIWALIIISPITVLLDRIFIYKRFTWFNSDQKLLTEKPTT